MWTILGLGFGMSMHNFQTILLIFSHLRTGAMGGLVGINNLDASVSFLWRLNREKHADDAMFDFGGNRDFDAASMVFNDFSGC